MPEICPFHVTEDEVHVPLIVPPFCVMVMSSCIVGLFDDAKVPLQAPEMSLAEPTEDGPLGLEHAEPATRAQTMKRRRIMLRVTQTICRPAANSRESARTCAPERIRTERRERIRARSYSSVLP